MCKGCLCMTCEAWEDCPVYAKCEQQEVLSCEKRLLCSMYQPQEGKDHENKI